MIVAVLAYHVNQQRGGTAIRRALGAPSARVAGAVIGDGLPLTSAGILMGSGGALILSRSLSGLLYDVRANDAEVLVAAAGVIVAAALLACAVPAIRAVRVDPISILREE